MWHEILYGGDFWDGGFSLDTFTSLITIGSSAPVHRSSGCRAHRNWRKRRAAGRA